jgi:hypothetical protein
LNIESLLFDSRLGFGFSSKPKPTDNELVILFIIGGITCAEIREIKELFEKSKDKIQVFY